MAKLRAALTATAAQASKARQSAVRIAANVAAETARMTVEIRCLATTGEAAHRSQCTRTAGQATAAALLEARTDAREACQAARGAEQQCEAAHTQVAMLQVWASKQSARKADMEASISSARVRAAVIERYNPEESDEVVMRRCEIEAYTANEIVKVGWVWGFRVQRGCITFELFFDLVCALPHACTIVCLMFVSRCLG